MADMLAPHFDLPFRFKYDGRGGTAVCVEEGTIDDLGNVTFLIVATPLGYRDEVPDFGMPDPVFKQSPVIPASVQDLVASQDERIGFIFQENSPREDELVRNIQIAISKRTGEK